MTQRHYFGTDGIRGRVGSDKMNVEFVLRLGLAAGRVFSAQTEKPATILIGRDTRISGMALQSALQAGLVAAGVHVKLLDVMPTPAIAHLTQSLGATAGVVISASHNPYHDNGIKFFDAQGMKISDHVELAIEHELTAELMMADSDSLGDVTTIADAKGRYAEFCKSIVDEGMRFDHIKCVVDGANGAGFEVGPQVFRELGLDVVSIACEPDGFNINEKCGATSLALLQEKVLAEKADVGIALDGDGDRLIMVDHQGEVVDGDEMLCILAHDRQTMENSHGIVGTVMSNLGLEKSLRSKGIDFVRANVGDRYVLETLIDKGWLLGGEASGHIVDLSTTTTGDGIISALQVLKVMVKQQKSLHELKQHMQKHPQVLINVPVNKVVKLYDYPDIDKAASEMRQKLQERGRILIRPSGTEPCVRVMVEGEDAKEVQESAEYLAHVVKTVIN